MNLKSVAMASGLVLTFAAGAWLSTIMLASPQRSNREAAVDQAQGQPTAAVRLPKTLPELPASDSILPPLPPLPEAPAAMPPPPPAVVHEPRAEPPIVAAQESSPPPPVEQTVQPPELPPSAPEPAPPAPPPAPVAAETLPAIPEAPPAMAEAPPPEPQPTSPVAEAAPPPTVAIPLVPAAEQEPEPEIDPGIAALSALVARSPSASVPNATAAPDVASAPPLPVPVRQPSPPAPAPLAAPSVIGPYFTIQVGSFQDPANAASLARSLGTKGWEAFVVDWTNGSGQVWKVVRVGRYLTEAQAAAASTELSSAANLRGNVIKVR
jgi:septal ring-binding cell division protein DamX